MQHPKRLVQRLGIARVDLKLQNRLVMAPLTRSRAIGNLPNMLMAQYYAQRSGAGLIITEGTSPSPNGLGYARIPGLFDEAHAQGWKAVTQAVHARGGKIFVQLWHTGRMSHVSFQPGQQPPLAPSAIKANAKTFLAGQGFVDT